MFIEFSARLSYTAWPKMLYKEKDRLPVFVYIDLKKN